MNRFNQSKTKNNRSTIDRSRIGSSLNTLKKKNLATEPKWIVTMIAGFNLCTYVIINDKFKM